MMYSIMTYTQCLTNKHSPAHDSAIRSMCLGLDEEMYFTGSAEGEIKVGRCFINHHLIQSNLRWISNIMKI